MLRGCCVVGKGEMDGSEAGKDSNFANGVSQAAAQCEFSLCMRKGVGIEVGEKIVARELLLG
jgi:hypothetical protein